MNEFFQRMKKRKLVQWGIAYIAAGFALLQGIDIVAQQFGWPEGPLYIINLAIIYSWLGEKDLALEQLTLSTQNPAGITFGDLKLMPFWDPLRGDPRFEKIVASLASKEVARSK
jgi:hypothetical protein